jgi:hypothetical protein
VTGLHHAVWLCGLSLLAAALPVIALFTKKNKEEILP